MLSVGAQPKRVMVGVNLKKLNAEWGDEASHSLLYAEGRARAAVDFVNRVRARINSLGIKVTDSQAPSTLICSGVTDEQFKVLSSLDELSVVVVLNQ